MDVSEKSQINIQAIIKEYFSKYPSDKINITKFTKFLGERNISLNNFYIQCASILMPILVNLNNLMKSPKFFSKVFEEQKILFKMLDILSEINTFVQLDEENKGSIINDFEEIFDVTFNIIIKVNDAYEKSKKNKDKNNKEQIENFMNKIILIIKIIFEKDYNSVENCLNKKENFDYFIENEFSRKLLYQILTMSLTYNKENSKGKGSLKLINSIIKYLINNIKDNNVNEYIVDIEEIIRIYKKHLNLITEKILYLLQKAMDLFNIQPNIKLCYDHLFHFFFNDIVFEGNTEQDYNSELMGILLELYKYLIGKKIKPLIDIFLIQLFFSVNLNMKEQKNNAETQIPWGQKYNWLLTETDYTRVVLDSFPLIFDEGIFAFYSGMLMGLINAPKKQKGYLPEIDFVRFFGNLEKFLNNKNYENKKDVLINLFTKKICDIMNYNSEVVKIVLQKCNIFEIIMKLIDKEKDDKIKIKLIVLIEKFIAQNKEDYEYNFNIDIRKDMENEVNYRINLFTVGYEYDNSKYNIKIGELINLMEEYSNNRKIIEFVQITNFLFKIIKDYQFKKINVISDDALLKFNNLLIQISAILSNPDSNEINSNESDLNIFINKFLNSIFKFIIELNLKKFRHKLAKYNTKYAIYYTKKIIEKKTLKHIIKNLLLSQNHIVKKKTLEYLLLVSIDEKNNLILSSYVLYIIIKIYYQDKNYKNIIKIFDTILNLVKKIEINAKILLYYDFVSIALNILQELYEKENEYEEYYKATFTFLEEIAKYLNQNLLMKYLNKVFIIFNKNVLEKIKDQDPFENPIVDMPSIGHKRENVHNSADIYEPTNITEENENKDDKNNINIPLNEDEEQNKTNTEEEKISKNINNELCFKLLELLKKNLQKDNSDKDYIILSNHIFQNPFINNLIFFDNLKFTDKDTYIEFKLTLKVDTYNGIDGFILLQIINQKNKINFILRNNSLEIKETADNSVSLLYTINDFDKILLADNKYHDIIISLETNLKTIELSIDNNKIIQKPIPYKYFPFNEFSVTIGFNDSNIDCEENSLDNKLKILENNGDCKNIKNGEKRDMCFVYISYFLIFNTLIDEKNLSSIFQTEKYLTSYPNLLNYLYRRNNKNYGKMVITEMNFQPRKIYLSQAKYIKNRINEISNFFYLPNNIFINRYISYKKVLNIFNIESPITTMYTISKNNNINEFCSLNAIWDLENINKNYIRSKLNNDFDINRNLMTFETIDFFFGFFFLLEKKLHEIKTKNKEKEELNNEQQDEQEEMGLGLYGDYLINGDILLEYISEIFEIVFLFPIIIIEKYFLGDNILKLKFFFFRNISLYKNDDIFVEKILKIFSKHEFLLMLIISEIFFDINIFSKLDFMVQNSIIKYFIEYSTKIDLRIENAYEEQRQNYIYNKILNSCINIIMFTELSTNENDEGKFQIDLLLDNLEKIISKLITIKNNKNLNNILGSIFYFTNDISIGFEEEKKNHLTKELYKNYSYIYSDESEEFDGYLEEKLNKISKQVTTLYKYIIQNEKVISLIKSYSENNNIKSECRFCGYLKKLFHLKSKFLYDEYSYIKLFNRFFRNYYQNFENNSGIFEPNNYIWVLSLKESCSKMQNKLFLKENKIKDFYYENPKTKVKTLYFKYLIDEEEYRHKFKELNKLFFYDRISCENEKLIMAMNPYLITKNYYNCLIINKLHKILSTFVLYEDRIIIYYYICLDSKNKVHIVRNTSISQTLWLKNQNEFNEELDEYIEENEKAIMDEIYKSEDKKKKKDPRANLSTFDYNKNIKFSRKEIYLNKINEIHKRDHLQIQNSLEIFTSNGESYFIVFNPETREIIFDQIISNIDAIYSSNPDKKIPIIKPSIINKENIFYMKHTPLQFLSSSDIEHLMKNHKKKKYCTKKTNYKSVLDGNSFRDEICTYWSKYKITNYDYLILLNTLAGRTFNDLSQYFIFPWIIKGFNKDILNWISSSIYRDLSVPIYACDADIEKIKNKYELLDDEKYHSGTFFSAHTFVCYFLVRVHPFIEIHLEIQGARFDARARMFNGAAQLSDIAEKFQELIPHLFYLPELYIKLNYILEDIEKDDEIMSDFVLPIWSKDDPRKFSLILRKLLENKKISKSLNQWIDLIFGYQQRGPNAEKALNTYRNSCYPLNKTDIENMTKSGEIVSFLYEKQELGYIPKQLFTSKHKMKEKANENKRIFFNNEEKMKQLIIKKIKEDLKKLSFNEFNDIIFPEQSSMNNLKNKSFYQGGISSLPSLMNISEHSNDNNKKEKEKIMKNFTKDENFFILQKNYFFLSKFCLVLTFCDNIIELINIKEKESKLFLLMENTEISCLITNSKGTEFFVGFTNGLINHYKIVYDENLKNDITTSSFISRMFERPILNDSKIFDDIYINNINFFLTGGIENSKIQIKLISKNNFNENNPHIYQRINLIALNESNNTLIALDQANIIYIMSLNNNCKLMHKCEFLSKLKYKMKEIIPLQNNGDFIIYSSYSVHLFSINGVPLCSLNLFDKFYENLQSITCCSAAFIYDVILFTAHKDGSIIIWKILNKEANDSELNEIDTKQKPKIFLKEYLYAYNYRNYMNSGIKLNECELQRKFEEIVIKYLSVHKKNKINNYVTFMKMSNDLDYMIIIDNEKNIYILTNFDTLEHKKTSIVDKIRPKQRCCNCDKEIIDIGIRPSLIEAKTSNNFDILTTPNNNTSQKNDNNNQLICEECEQKLQHTENFLYTN